MGIHQLWRISTGGKRKKLFEEFQVSRFKTVVQTQESAEVKLGSDMIRYSNLKRFYCWWCTRFFFNLFCRSKMFYLTDKRLKMLCPFPRTKMSKTEWILLAAILCTRNATHAYCENCITGIQDGGSKRYFCFLIFLHLASVVELIEILYLSATSCTILQLNKNIIYLAEVSMKCNLSAQYDKSTIRSTATVTAANTVTI